MTSRTNTPFLFSELRVKLMCNLVNADGNFVWKIPPRLLSETRMVMPSKLPFERKSRQDEVPSLCTDGIKSSDIGQSFGSEMAKSGLPNESSFLPNPAKRSE